MSSTYSPKAARPARLAVLAALAMTALPITSARAGDIAAIGSATVTELRSPDETGALSTYATGGGMSVMIIDPKDEVSLGAEAQVTFLSGQSGLSGDQDRRVVHLGVSMIVSYEIDDAAAVPFMRIGLGISGVSAPDIDEARRRSVMAGVQGAAGLHGFLSDKLYWRAELGFLGAGPGGVTGQLGLGYTFGSM
jgi:hypothetical protein